MREGNFAIHVVMRFFETMKYMGCNQKIELVCVVENISLYPIRPIGIGVVAVHVPLNCSGVNLKVNFGRPLLVNINIHMFAFNVENHLQIIGSVKSFAR